MDGLETCQQAKGDIELVPYIRNTMSFVHYNRTLPVDQRPTVFAYGDQALQAARYRSFRVLALCQDLGPDKLYSVLRLMTRHRFVPFGCDLVVNPAPIGQSGLGPHSQMIVDLVPGLCRT
jgi:hypothetical protein